MVSNVPRRNRAAVRSTRRKGTGRHLAVAREGGRLHNGHCAAARGKPRGPDGSVGRAEGNGPWHEVSCVDGGAIRCRVSNEGQRRRAGAPNGWRDWCRETRRGRRMRRQGNTRRRAYRDSLRNPNNLADRERIAHHNLAHRPVPRPRCAAGGTRFSSATSAPIFTFFNLRSRSTALQPCPAVNAVPVSSGTHSLTPRAAVSTFWQCPNARHRSRQCPSQTSSIRCACSRAIGRARAGPGARAGLASSGGAGRFPAEPGRPGRGWSGTDWRC